MAQGPFRQQAVDKHHVRLYGPILLRQPIFYLVAFFYLFLFSILSIELLVFGEFARKEMVSGYLVPQMGLLKVKSSRAGFVNQLPVAQGDVLFLDEAPIHLDIAGESIVNEHIKQLKVTRIMVAHRPETIATADRVIEIGIVEFSVAVQANGARRPTSLP